MIKVLILFLVTSAVGVYLPGCTKVLCHTKDVNLMSQLQKVQACDDCRTLNFKFCGKFENDSYCFGSIPPFCKPLSNLAQQDIVNIFNICYIPPKAFLPLPVIQNNLTLNIAVPRFFEQKPFEQYRFQSLSLFLLFPLSKGGNCSKAIFPSRPVHKNRDCLWTIPIAMPTIDSADAKNDPFYYDDQTDMSVSFSPKLIPVAKNSKMSIWYSVKAEFVETHQNAALNFSLPLYSYRKDIPSE